MGVLFLNSLFKIIISMVIWGSVGLFVKNIDLPSMETVFLRAIIASAVLILYGLALKFGKENNKKIELDEKQRKNRKKSSDGSRGKLYRSNFCCYF